MQGNTPEVEVHQTHRGLILSVLVVMLLVSGLPARGVDWDTKSDTWVATDALGRKLPSYAECGPVRPGKYVGIFYFLWLGQHGTNGPYDITKLLAASPTNPAWGGVNTFHHWGESELGYYLSNDAYVMRKHCQMLVDAGVDTLIFDVTNNYSYKNNYMALLGVYQGIRNNGGKTPQVCFLVNPENNALVQTLYTDLYSKNLYPDLWFRWLGKPLILTKPDGLSDTLQGFFTFRKTWAWSAGAQDNWTWLDNYPQVTAWHTPGVAEEISVSVAGHPTSFRGRSFHSNAQPPIDQYAQTPTMAQGLTFSEQWQRALQVDPQFVFITGWNEWVAQRFVSSSGQDWFLGAQLPVGGTYFVDAYSQEFSRDIEPMKGGYGDNYYYQMVSNIRRFKGVRPPDPPSPPKPITIDNDFSDWADVAPEFRDTTQDTQARNSLGWGSAGTYTNYTGRNDIAKLKVTYDADNVYFYAETVGYLTSVAGSNWMLLFIDSDCNSATGWQGYDYLVNYPVTGTTTTLKRNSGGWNWVDAISVPYGQSASKVEIAIPRSAIGQSGTPDVTLDFHWADNIQKTNDVTEFAVSGDSAPNRRANYHYGKVIPWPSWEFNDGVIPSGTTSHGISGLTVTGGCLRGSVVGADPYIVGPRLPDIDANAKRYVHVRMKNSSGTLAELFWGTAAEPFHKAGREIAFAIAGDNSFHDYIIDMSTNPQWTGSVNTIRLDPCEVASGAFEIDFIRVMQTPDLGTISGQVIDSSGGGIAGAALSTNVGGRSTTTAADGSFTLPNLVSGVYNLTVSKFGNAGKVLRNVAVVPGQISTVSVALNSIPDAGSVAGAKQLADGANIALFSKALYLRQGGFGYVEEPNRSNGIRIQGAIPLSAPKMVSLVGSLATTPGGERYVQLSEIASVGPVALRPVGVSSRSLSSSLLSGLYIRTWGIVKPGSVTANSFVLADELDGVGVKVVTQGTPAVTPGAFTLVTGAVGYDNGRLIIAE